MTTITTASFLELSPDAQRALALDSILNAKAEIFRLTATLAKHNGWMATVDLLQADTEFISNYKRLEKQLHENIDSLTEQILIEAQRKRQISTLLADKKQTKTPQS